MIEMPWLQWGLTLVFAFTAAFSAYRMMVDRAGIVRFGQLLHLIMSAAMILMTWPWGLVVPAVPQGVLFSLAGVWFAVVLLQQLRGRIALREVGGHAAWHQGLHAVMMAAMAWMLFAMADPPQLGQLAQGGHAHGEMSGWIVLLGIGFLVLLIAASVIYAIEFVECLGRQSGTWAGHTGDMLSSALMSIGMVAMVMPMLQV